MENGKRNTAFLLIGAGLYLAIGHIAGFMIANVLVLAALGFAMVQGTADTGRKKLAGYILLIIAGAVVLANHSGLLLGIILAGAGWIWYKKETKPDRPEIHTTPPEFVKKHVAASIHMGKGEAWTARSSDINVAIAEIQIDLTTAFFEQPNTVIQLQGIVGDIDIVAPEDIGLTVHVQVTLGEVKVAGEREAGLMNQLLYRSPNADTALHRVEIYISYIIGDVDVKVL